MSSDAGTQELRERLDVIESMILEGRRKTESWGWSFLLWGTAYFIAIVWASWGDRFALWGHQEWAWPVTTVAAMIVTIVVGKRTGRGRPNTTMSRAVAAVWTVVGVSMFLIFTALGMSGRLDQHLFVALVATLLGVANGASGIILKWKMQFWTAVLWWASAAAACFVSDAQLTVLFLADLFVCQILFGIYAMRLEVRRRNGGLAHA